MSVKVHSDAARAIALATALCAACSGERSRAESAPPSTPAPAPLAPEPAPAPAEVDAGATTPDGGAADAGPDFAEVNLGTPKRVLEGAVKSIAIGEKGRVAVLADVPQLLIAGAWKRIELPERYRAKQGERDATRIFFGRDNLPRLMGARTASDGSVSSVYLRWRGGAWQTARSEIGKLGRGEPGGLYGVLGHADPEVVCKQGMLCIIKRRTGWTTLDEPAPGERPYVELFGEHARVLTGSRVIRLDGARWKPLAKLGSDDATGMWTDGERPWVAHASSSELSRWNGEAWSRSPAPIAGPRRFWGKPGDVWLVGDGGAAHHDGKAWRRVAGVAGPLRVVAGGEKRVLLGGDAGLLELARE